MEDRYLNKKEVSAMVGVGTVTIWRAEKKGAFPARRQISPGRVGWLESEVQEWMESRKRVEGGGMNRDGGDAVAQAMEEATTALKGHAS